MPEANVNGVRLHYEELGDGAPIVCIHGTGSSGLVWGEALGRLSHLGRVIAYDRRGCSRSERPEPYERTSVIEHGDDAAALLEALGAAPAVVIGRSYGGAVALDIALRRPELLRALVLLEAGDIHGLAPTADRWSGALDERIAEAAAQGEVSEVGKAMIEEVLGEGGWSALPEPMRELFTQNGPAILAEARGEGLAVEAAALARIEQPALVVSADESPTELRELSAALAKALPDARTARVGGGHLIDPAAPEVLAFIEEVAS